MKTALILASGKGIRMLPLTKDTPKPLLKINNKAMIDYVLDLIRFHGFERIGINVSYSGEKISEHIKNENVNVVTEKDPTGSAGGILAISKKLKLDSPFLVMASDMMVDFDLSEIYKFHLKHKGLATLCCYFRKRSQIKPLKSGQIVFNKKTKRITQILERSPEIRSQWVNSSVYIFDPKIIEVLQSFEKKEIDIARDLIPYLLSFGQSIYAYPVNRKKFYQLGIDTPERIAVAEADIETGKFAPRIP